MTTMSPSLEEPGLAPMEGVSDPPFRLFLHLAARPSWMHTPFLRVTATHPKTRIPKEFAPELHEWIETCPYLLVPQIMASDAEDFLRVAPWVLQRAPYVELNCGCPAPRSVGHGAGASLLKDPESFFNTLQTLTSNLGPRRLAVKMRTGFDDDRHFSELIDAAASLPLSRLTIHGRTRRQGYRGEAAWDLIGQAAARLARGGAGPVVGSGDISRWQNLQGFKIQAPAAASAIIGRGAIGNPWIFAEMRQKAPVRVDGQTIVQALAVFALLHELYQSDFEKFLIFANDIVFKSLKMGAGTDETAWSAVGKKLHEALQPQATSHLRQTVARPKARTCGRFALGRCKFVWSKLCRSLHPVDDHRSLPTADRPTLRAKTLEDFLMGVTTFCDKRVFHVIAHVDS